MLKEYKHHIEDCFDRFIKNFNKKIEKDLRKQLLAY